MWTHNSREDECIFLGEKQAVAKTCTVITRCDGDPRLLFSDVETEAQRLPAESWVSNSRFETKTQCHTFSS